MKFHSWLMGKSAFAFLCCVVLSSAPLMAAGKSTSSAAARKTQWIKNAVDSGYLTAAQAAAANGNVAKINAAIRANSEQKEVQTAINEGLVTDEDVQRVNADRQKVKDLVALRADKDLTNASDEAHEKAKAEYLKNPNKSGKERAQLVLAADSLGIDEEKARDAGVQNSRDLFGLVAQLALVGDDKANTRIKTPEFWQDVKTKGKDGVVRDAYAESVGISPALVAKMKLTDVMNAAAAAQDLKLDATSADFWKKVRKDGVIGLYKDKLVQDNKLPPDAVKGLTLKEIQAGIKTAKGDKAKLRDADYWKDLKKTADEAKNNAKDVADSAAQNAAKPPLKRPGGIGVAEIIVAGRKPTDKGKATDTTHNNTTPATSAPPPKVAPQDGGRFGGAAMAGTKDVKQVKTDSPPVAETTNPDGTNAPVGQDDAALPGAGGSQISGSTNPSGSDTPAGTSGSGFSQDAGEEAGAGGVYSVIGIDQDANGSVSYTWMASGTMGNDGLYITTYTQDSGGNWSWTVEKALTGEVVNAGTGSPPDASVVGTSTQSTDGDEMVFPTTDGSGESDGNDGKKEDDDKKDDDDDGDDDKDKDKDKDNADPEPDAENPEDDEPAKTEVSSTPNPDAETRSNPIQNWSLPGGKSTERRDKRALADRKGGGHTDPTDSDRNNFGVASLGLQMLLADQSERTVEQSIGAHDGSQFGAPGRRKVAYLPTASEMQAMLIRIGGGVTTPTPDAPAGSGIIGGLIGTPLGGLPPIRGGQFSAGRINVNLRNKLKSNVVSGQ